jgi:[ribosomal protein S18]-alanine N-acetyltransferase
MTEREAPSDGPSEWSIGPMTAEDLDAVASIEARAYEATWGRAVFEGELERDFARIDVLRRGGVVAAFCNYWLVADEIHLLSIATEPAHWGQGMARRLLEHLIDLGARGGRRCITLEVRRSNERALDLYRRCGFEEVGSRRRYYADGEDAIVMLRHLDPAGVET